MCANKPNAIMINILIADDHQLLIDGIKATLAGIEDFNIAAEVYNGYQVLEKLESGLPVDIRVFTLIKSNVITHQKVILKNIDRLNKRRITTREIGTAIAIDSNDRINT